MRPLALAALVLATAIGAQPAPPDSSQAFAAKVAYRSPLESLAALPGQLLYAPVFVAVYGGRLIGTALWEKRLLDRAKAHLTFAEGRLGIRPLSNTSLGTGLRLFGRDLAGYRQAQLTSTLGASGRKRQQHRLALSQRGGWRLEGHWLRQPKEPFYGIGTDTDEEDKTAYRLSEYFLALTRHREIGDLVLDMGLHYRRADTGKGSSSSAPSATTHYTPEQLPGLRRQLDFAGADVTLRTAHVDVPGSPTRGFRLRTGLDYTQSLDDDFSHGRLHLASEHFFELFHRRTLSLRLGTDWRWAPSGQAIPFYQLASLGGQEILRGYNQGRFRDRGAVWVGTTYKFPVWELVEGALFYETGRTLHAPADFDLEHWRDSYGGGLQMWVPEGVIFAQTLAFSDEQWRLIFNAKTDF
ncbi:MAG: BamA/TamA family outer membrane protein [Candidatus Latescibacteria bacterium]|nr:BamA/TamA family outer membrane protein [Candidatus Latescibacterota bacterium]